MPSLSLEALAERFPQFRVAVVIAEGLTIGERDEALDAEITAAQARARARWAGTELSAIPGVAAWRRAYRDFGIKKTSYRSSVERLLKRVLAGDALPRVNALVDLYNMVSLDEVLCLGCDDLDRVEGDLAFRFSRPDDSFIDMGAAPGEDAEDPPKPGEVVYADARKVLCRRWNWRQDARSAVTPATRRVVLTAQSNGSGDVEAAAARLAAGIGRACGGGARLWVADRERPTVAW
ncbi:MAG TPA: phenylalanine--tRNA ligase beta subunit-related protein [Roseiarcus sp.]|nr:phenylalanine--tRNA ligase beta subunit-related protein [Roseiarcus sp.]